MCRIKTDWHSCLTEETIDNLMRISNDSMPAAEFSPLAVISRFFSTPRCTEVAPYGPTKRKHSGDEQDSSIDQTDEC